MITINFTHVWNCHKNINNKSKIWYMLITNITLFGYWEKFKLNYALKMLQVGNILRHLIKTNAKHPTGLPTQQDLKEFHGYVCTEHNLRETLIRRCLGKQDTIILNQQKELIAILALQLFQIVKLLHQNVFLLERGNRIWLSKMLWEVMSSIWKEGG